MGCVGVGGGEGDGLKCLLVNQVGTVYTEVSLLIPEILIF